MNQHNLYYDHNAILRIINSKKHMYSSNLNANVLNMNLVKIIIIVHTDLINNRNNNRSNMNNNNSSDNNNSIKRI